jgi:ATP-dependent DNA helicase RecG
MKDSGGETRMKLEALLSQIALGEDSTRQFKADVKNADSLASEMADFANTGSMVLSGHCDPTNDLLGMEPVA